MARRTLLTCVALFLLAELVLLPRIGAAAGFCFDEVFYVPAARAFASWTANTNRLHPPLGKYVIAIGVALFGDRPLGWRVMSCVFGGLTLAAVYCWSLALFRRQGLAVWTALVVLVNQLFYVLARTAQLDVFLAAFIAWGAAALTAALRDDVAPQRARALLYCAGVMFGLATAV